MNDISILDILKWLATNPKSERTYEAFYDKDVVSLTTSDITFVSTSTYIETDDENEQKTE
jgi:hypothetical protein